MPCLHLLSQASLLYSNTNIQYISTSNPLARKQANSVTSLQSAESLCSGLVQNTPVYSELLSPFQSLIIRESAFNEDELTSPPPTDEFTKEEPDLPPQLHVSNSGVQGITKLWNVYILSLMTPQFALSSHSNGIKRSLGSCQFPDDRKLAIVVPV